MSDALDIHAKLDAILAHVATLPTREDLAEIRATMATRADLTALRDDLTALRADLTALRADMTRIRAEIMDRIDRLQDVVTAQGADLIKTLSEIMDRIDRMQNVLSLQHEEHIVDVGTPERVERMSKVTREEVAGLAEIVTPMLRIIHTLRGQIDELFEQVRLLKQGKAA